MIIIQHKIFNNTHFLLIVLSLRITFHLCAICVFLGEISLMFSLFLLWQRSRCFSWLILLFRVNLLIKLALYPSFWLCPRRVRLLSWFASFCFPFVIFMICLWSQSNIQIHLIITLLSQSLLSFFIGLNFIIAISLKYLLFSLLYFQQSTIFNWWMGISNSVLYECFLIWWLHQR